MTPEQEKFDELLNVAHQFALLGVEAAKQHDREQRFIRGSMRLVIEFAPASARLLLVRDTADGEHLEQCVFTFGTPPEAHN